jgi:7-keto-8-aminopelargonate synthetase-like enzyme
MCRQKGIDRLPAPRFAGLHFLGCPAACPGRAAMESFKVILDEPWRMEKLWKNTRQFIDGLKGMGFDTMLTETAIVPVLCGTDERAFALTQACQRNDVFVLPVVSPAVPEGLSRLRATVTAAHETDEIQYAMDVIEKAGKEIGII